MRESLEIADTAYRVQQLQNQVSAIQRQLERIERQTNRERIFETVFAACLIVSLFLGLYLKHY